MVFARNPVPGEVKTRLIPALGKKGAANLYKKLIKHTLKMISSCNISHVDLYTTATKNPAFYKSCVDDYGIPLKQQTGADLGMRMFNAFENSLPTNDWAILIGTDCPTMQAADLVTSIGELESGADAVIGPAVDGGYYLIGLRRNDESLFSNMPWGTRQVASLTYEKMKALNWRVSTLPLRRDIDRPEDLEYLPELEQ